MKEFNQTVRLSDIDKRRPIPPRKLQLDRTLSKYKLNKSLPVSPVSEERSFSDYFNVESQQNSRRSFSYFLDTNQKQIDEGFKQVCSDIARFCKNEDEGSFSSDSLEECSFNSTRTKKTKYKLPRRCVSNNEIYNTYTNEPGESFYLNPSNKNSQDSILSSEDNFDGYKSHSFCNSMESLASNESDCKSAPLELLFSPYRKVVRSATTACCSHLRNISLCTSETQTDFSDLNQIINPPPSFSDDKRGSVSFFVETQNHRKTKKKQTNVEKQNNLNKGETMYIPTLEAKNRQYEKKYCNVLNNKPEPNTEIFSTAVKNNAENLFVLTENNSARNLQQTSSLDRHLFTKNLFESDRVTHKPPKGLRRNSSRSRKTKTTYEYVKKDEFAKKINNIQKINNIENFDSFENTLEVNYKETNIERECENGNNSKLLTELYDSLEKIECSSKMECDSLEVNINRVQSDDKMFDSLEFCTTKNVPLFSNTDHIAVNIENIKILNEIQRNINKINILVDIFKDNMCSGRVKQLSCMYERLTNTTSCYVPKAETFKFRKRNLSLPNFVERNLSIAESSMQNCTNYNQGVESAPAQDSSNLFNMQDNSRNPSKFTETIPDARENSGSTEPLATPGDLHLGVVGMHSLHGLLRCMETSREPHLLPFRPLCMLFLVRLYQWHIRGVISCQTETT